MGILSTVRWIAGDGIIGFLRIKTGHVLYICIGYDSWFLEEQDSLWAIIMHAFSWIPSTRF